MGASFTDEAASIPCNFQVKATESSILGRRLPRVVLTISKSPMCGARKRRGREKRVKPCGHTAAMTNAHCTEKVLLRVEVVLTRINHSNAGFSW